MQTAALENSFLVDANIVRKGFATRYEPHKLDLMPWGPWEMARLTMRRTHAPAINALWEANEVGHIPSLFEASKVEAIKLVTSNHIESERSTNPALRTDRSNEVFDLPALKILEDPCFERTLDLTTRTLVRSRIHPPPHLAERYNQILKAIGPNKSADAAHILLAENAGLTGFVTMDKRLKNAVRNSKLQLKTKIVLPSDVTNQFGLQSWSDATFQRKVDSSDIFVRQYIVEIAQRKRIGPLKLLATPWVGKRQFKKLEPLRIKAILQTLRRQVRARWLFRSFGATSLWRVVDEQRARDLKRLLSNDVSL